MLENKRVITNQNENAKNQPEIQKPVGKCSCTGRKWKIPTGNVIVPTESVMVPAENAIVPRRNGKSRQKNQLNPVQLIFQLVQSKIFWF